MAKEDTVITQRVCLEGDMQDGELREVEVGGYVVLLLRQNVTFSAVGSKCPHYGAPLSKGYLARGRLRCPWHGACFSVKTGDIEEYPTLDCLPTFKVTVEDGQVFITATLKELKTSQRVKPMSTNNPLHTAMVLVLGAGAAALTCAETLRQEGYTGRIVLATRDKYLPYDKTKLNKELDLKVESIYLRPQAFLDAYNIDVWTEKEVISVDAPAKTVHFGDGTCQVYDSLLIATGSSARRLRCPGSNLQNVCVLQTPEDAKRIAQLAANKAVMIAGASFIGMAVAACLSSEAACVQVVEKTEFPYQLTLGKDVGSVAMKMLQEKGVKFFMKTEITELQGESGKVTHAILDSGQRIPADVVVVGIGVTANASFLQNSPVTLDTNGAILVDLFMRTNVSDIFAAGDVASFPVALLGGETTSIAHWQVAQAHGHVAALNILKKQQALHTVPFFWTTLFDQSIRYAGCGKGYTETVLKGNLEERRFLIFYIRDGFVTAAASLNYDPMVALVAEVLYSGRRISKLEAEMMDGDKLQVD